ncbi:MAG: hypothetical protein ACKVOH_03950 [Chlamydiales bacterium]
MKNLLIALLLLTACTADKPKKHAPLQNILCVIHSVEGRFLSVANNPNEGLFSMIDVDRSVAFFTKGPGREAGSVALEQFLSSWHGQAQKMHDDPPNAGFVFYGNREAQYSEIAIEVRDPMYDPVNNVLSFHIFSILKEFPFDEKHMEEVTLFIDLTTDILRPL